MFLIARQSRAKTRFVSREIRPDYAQLLLLPPSIDDWVPKEHPVRFVRDVVDALDLSALGLRDFAAGDVGRPHYAPELLLKVWLFGWMERIRSSRALERACMRDLAFVWLTGNLHPDHNTLWRFFRDNKPAFRKLLKQIVKVAVKAELVGFALHAIDGTKIASASSMETAQHRKTLEEQLKKLDSIIDESIAATEAAEGSEQGSYALPAPMRDPKARKAKVAELLAELDEAKTNHRHRKDPNARVMKGRRGMILGFNAQAVVDEKSDLILAADVSSDQTDHAQLIPMLDEARDNAGANAEQSLADAGYWSGPSIAEAERRHLPVIVNEQAESSNKGELSKSNFSYDAERNGYVCPRGEFLPLEGVWSPTAGKTYSTSIYRCRNKTCPVRSDCTKDKKGRSIKRIQYADALERNTAKLRDPAMRELMSRRKSIIEHIFALAKTIDGFSRFTARGLDGVRAQWALVCAAINMRKLSALCRAGGIRLALGS
jgi:transposase